MKKLEIKQDHQYLWLLASPKKVMQEEYLWVLTDPESKKWSREQIAEQMTQLSVLFDVKVSPTGDTWRDPDGEVERFSLSSEGPFMDDFIAAMRELTF